MTSENNKNISRAYSKAANWQIIITLLIAAVSLLIGSADAALSALMGGGSVIIGAYIAMRYAKQNNDGSAGVILLTLLKAEAIKIFVIVLLLLASFKFYQGLVPLSLIGGLAGSALVSGAGLRAVNNQNNE